MCSMIVKNIEEYGMTHEREDDFGVEVGLRVLEEHPMGHQEKDWLVEEKVCFLKKEVKSVVPKVDVVSWVDEVFDGALGGDRDEDFAKGDGV
ncbi:hypothetical protein Tco_0454829 [Tanacetum coccineum]